MARKLSIDELLKKAEVTVSLYDVREVWYSISHDDPCLGAMKRGTAFNRCRFVTCNEERALAKSERILSSIKDKLEGLDKYESAKVAEMHGISPDTGMAKGCWGYDAVVSKYQVRLKDIEESGGQVFWNRGVDGPLGKIVKADNMPEQDRWEGISPPDSALRRRIY